MHRRLIQCYAEGRPGQWEAVCLDFDIAVQGSSYDEVYRSLNQAVGMYLQSVLAMPAPERDRFLARRAPLSMRLKYLWAVFRSSLLGRQDNGKERHEFMMPCAA